MYHRPDRWTAISLSTFKYRVCLPLHAFVITLLGFVRVSLAQLVPNSYIHIISFIALYQELGISPTINLFFSLFTMSRSRESEFQHINKQSNRALEKRPLMKTSSSNKGCHSLWSFIRGPNIHEIPDWAEFSRANPTLGEISPSRLEELVKIIEKLPMKEWDIKLLNNQNWLYMHKCKF